jgi:putative transposase
MPDHMHIWVGIPGDAQLSKLIRDFKRITARVAKIDWQRNFFDHRLRHDESEDEKAAYIRANPVRAGLVAAGEEWPYVIDANDLDPKPQC